MSYEQILYAIADRIATITMNRPERLNAWTPHMGGELYDAFASAARDPEVRVIVVTGAGRGFCAGADMSNLRGIQDGRSDDAPQARGTERHSSTIPASFMISSETKIGALNLTAMAMASLGRASMLITFPFWFSSITAKKVLSFKSFTIT